MFATEAAERRAVAISAFAEAARAEKAVEAAHSKLEAAQRKAAVAGAAVLVGGADALNVPHTCGVPVGGASSKDGGGGGVRSRKKRVARWWESVAGSTAIASLGMPPSPPSAPSRSFSKMALA